MNYLQVAVIILKRTMCHRTGAKRRQCIARLSEINSIIIPVAKTREHTAYDYAFQEIPMNFWKCLLLSGKS